jgi:hypothetical protein
MMGVQSSPDPFGLTAAEIQRLLAPGAPCLPELEAARRDLDAVRRAPQTRMALEQTQSLMEAVEQIPPLSYTHYRTFMRSGDRRDYETPYFLRRASLAAAALRLFLGQTDLKDGVQDAIWAICEETDWVVPAHEGVMIDLFAAETGLALADMLMLLGDTLDAEVRSRVRMEIERRIFDPYLRLYASLWWYKGHLNWNGVCNSSVAATFLLLEPEPGRAARALELALAGLRVFLDTAFERDGSSTEGVGYWHYGLTNFVALAEMLRARTDGAIDLLASEPMRAIAAFPSKLLLSGTSFATFSDCDEIIHFEPGIIARLAERTGEESLLALLAPSALMGRNRWLTMLLRNILWWDGAYHAGRPLDDVYLPNGGIARLTARTPQGSPVALAIKAGHNDENHNHNDVGSFILHADGESLLADPGRGLYTRQYFGPQRYESIFANSYGHSVPRVGGQLQSAGREACGQFLSVETTGSVKRAEIEMARAYPVATLDSARRQVTLDGAGTVWLQDTFRFSENPVEIEEAFITWLDVDVAGSRAVVHGRRHDLCLTVEAPEGARFEVEKLEAHRQTADGGTTLSRIGAVLPVAADVQIRVRMEIMAIIDVARTPQGG